MNNANANANANEPQGLLELIQAGKVYQRREVLTGVTLKLEAGQAIALLGPNGSGKSTLLTLLAGLSRPTSGQRRLLQPGLRIGYAPDRFPASRLTPDEYLTGLGKLHGHSGNTFAASLDRLYAAFQMETLRTRPMKSFSKGQLQKINLIQCLLSEPELLLLDEPMSGLDPAAKDTLLVLLQERKKQATAMVYIIHDPQWIQPLADQVLSLQAGQLRVTPVTMVTPGTPGTPGTPAASFSIERQTAARPDAVIRCSNLTGQMLEQVLQLEGVRTAEHPGKETEAGLITLRAAADRSDEVLRRILAGGGSVESLVRVGDEAAFPKPELQTAFAGRKEERIE